jgi:hypothetical protein
MASAPMRLVACGLAALLAPASAACGKEEPACFSGDHRACSCAGGASGYQSCSASGEGYERCVCDGTTPGLDGSFEAGTDAGHGDAALAKLTEPCATNEECESGLCFPFNAKGPHCSKACTTNEQCEAPSTGCNNQGICKVP